MKTYIHYITPVSKPRQTRSDVWKKRPAVLRYRAFADECRAAGIELRDGDTIIFGLPMPKSWSGLKRHTMSGAPHKQKPDLDNLLKALMDAVMPEDCGLWCLNGVSKFWVQGPGHIVIQRATEQPCLSPCETPTPPEPQPEP
jgi:hypothetical protein